MSFDFSHLPDVVINYVRDVFRHANDKVSRSVSMHPSMHEETLDHILVMDLSAAPSAFFAAEMIGISIESHWLGSRWMFGRWEIADIAFFVLIRANGHLLTRKVALLQTKRLYSREIDVADLSEAEYRIGIGRLADRTDPTFPLSTQRAFSFDTDCEYRATQSGHEQIDRIDAYIDARGIPVYYGFYNPVSIPFRTSFPCNDGVALSQPNNFGCRILPSPKVHAAIQTLKVGVAPSLSNLELEQTLYPGDTLSNYGWRLENFIADEVLRCREGRVFDDTNDANLRGLLYERSAPIAAAITITVDIGRA